MCNTINFLNSSCGNIKSSISNNDENNNNGDDNNNNNIHKSSELKGVGDAVVIAN